MGAGKDPMNYDKFGGYIIIPIFITEAILCIRMIMKWSSYHVLGEDCNVESLIIFKRKTNVLSGVIMHNTYSIVLYF